MAGANRSLGRFHLTDLPPAPRGVPQIEVTFDIDANGIVHVSAKDRATAKVQSMTITGQTALSSDEIQRMVADAEAHAEEDRRRREEAEVRNTADSLVYQTEKLLADHGDQQVEDALGVLKQALQGSDVDAIRRATETVAAASQSLGQRLYEQPASEADDDIVDAEIVDGDIGDGQAVDGGRAA
jgi:molecular chaperone DnaK